MRDDCGTRNGEQRSLENVSFTRQPLCLISRKVCVLFFYLLMEMFFLAVFVITGLIATINTGITEALPAMYVLKWCAGLFFTMLLSVATMWAITVLFVKPLLSVDLNMLLVIPSVILVNTPFWVVYPYCYSGYLVSCFLHDFTAKGVSTGFNLFPFLPCAILVFVLVLTVAVKRFGKNEVFPGYLTWR